MNNPFLYGPALELLKKNLNGNERVVIRGASGWVGRTAATMLHSLNVPISLFASRSRLEKIGEKNFYVSSWNIDNAINFEPTHIIDAGYITREFTSGMYEKDYISMNKLMTDQTIDLMKKVKGIKLISFSSGVTRMPSEKGKPYTLAKQRDEKIFEEFANKTGKQISNFRIWSITGGLVTKKRGFAFSELILQALEGEIKVRSNKPVYRRFCLVDEIIAFGFLQFENPYRLVDTGGDLVEIHDLALKIKEIVNPEANLEFEKIELNAEPDNYFSKNWDWDNLAKIMNYRVSSIEEQIKLVKESLILQKELNER